MTGMDSLQNTVHSESSDKIFYNGQQYSLNNITEEGFHVYGFTEA